MHATIHGISLHYELHGAGMPVLFVHGFPLTRKLWEPLIAPLQDEYRLILPDLRGHGQSEASAESSMAQYADDLAALLDEINEPRPVVLVGFSMGGYIAFEFFRRYPERVRALVLADTRAQPDDEAGAKGRYETAEKVLREGSHVVADSMAKKLFAPDAPAALRDEWHAIMAATPPAGVAAALHAMAQRPDSRPTLDTITRPTLILVGEQDMITPPADAELMHTTIPGSRLEVIPGAGHMPPVEQPARFTAYLQQFLDELGETTG